MTVVQGEGVLQKKTEFVQNQLWVEKRRNDKRIAKQGMMLGAR
jgi:hypothetical protein